jgi:predicted N-acyltransferase
MCGTRQPFAHVRWLRLLELIASSYQPHYLQIWQGDELVAGAICYPQRHFHLSAHMSSSLLAWGAEQGLKMVGPMSCHLPLFAYPGIILAEGAPSEALLPLLAEALMKIQREEKSQLLSINPLTTENDTMLSQWPGFTPTRIVEDAVIDIAWDSYEDYQMWLPGKKRAEIRRVRNRAADAGVVVKECSLAETDDVRVEQLIQQVRAHHGSAYPFKPEMVRQTAVSLNPGDYAHLVAIHRGDIIGTLTLFLSEGTMLVRWAGLEYERTQDTYAYHLLMSETVRIAIERGARQLKLGGTSFTLKKQLGARLESRIALLRLRNPILNRAMRLALARQLT